MSGSTGWQGDYGAQYRVLLIGEAPLAGLVATSSDMELTGPVAIADAAGRLGADVALDLVLIDASGVLSSRLVPVIDAVSALADAGGPQIIVNLGRDQIDEFATPMLGGRIQLLCDASDAEWLAALAIARAAPGGGAFRETDKEAERLRRLNDEVARIAETLARLTRREPGRTAGAGSVADRAGDYRAAPMLSMRDDIDAAEIRQTIRARRLRDQFFGSGLFEDPAWDMLLDLFAAELERSRVSVSSLCIAAAVAPTTALRWIGRMTEAGLLAREPDPFDRRRAYMVLSDKSRAGMRDYWAAVRRIEAAAV